MVMIYLELTMRVIGGLGISLIYTERDSYEASIVIFINLIFFSFLHACCYAKYIKDVF